MSNRILLVRVPTQEAVGGRELRDYILESLAQGVLVLSEDASCEVMELPTLSGVKISQNLYTSEDFDEHGPPPVEVTTGRNKEEKLTILKRLREYRRVHGLGCWDQVAKAAGGNVTPDLIRDMLLGNGSPPIADWRKIDRAVARLEGGAAVDG